MAAPTAVTGNTLQPVGGFDSPRLDIVLPVDSAVTMDVYSGTVCHVDATSGHAKPGVDANGVALFAFDNSYDSHVKGAGVSVSGYSLKDEAYIGATPESGKGGLMFLVATGGYEIETTEYDTSVSYPPNKPLTAPTGDTLGTSGQITVGAHYIDACCGVVSRGEVSAGVGNGRKSLAFWTTHMPILSSTTITAINA